MAVVERQAPCTKFAPRRGMGPPYRVHLGGDEPVVAAAIHCGHDLRLEVARAIALSEAERLREEDPFTATWTDIAGTRLVGCRSRFEVDLNRPREAAVYRSPSEAWGLNVWRDGEPSARLVEQSLHIHDAFYADTRVALRDVERRFGPFVLLDLHSYNHRRGGPAAPPDDPAANPEINIGTGTVDRTRWGPLIDRFIGALRGSCALGRPVDVRENIRFRGGHLSSWANREFRGSACAIAIEVKKFFMDEWTGVPDAGQVKAIGELLASTVPSLLDELERLR